MRRMQLVIGGSLLAGGLLALSLPARAQQAGVHWDDSHMQSNFSHRFGSAPPRPPIVGTDRYHQVAGEPAPTPPVGVAETTFAISQHEWKPGGPSTGGSGGGDGSAPPWAASTGFSVPGAIPTVSSGVRSGTSLGRGSSLHSGSSSTRRSTR